MRWLSLIAGILLSASVATTCSWVQLTWYPSSPDADPLYPFSNGLGEKVGFIDQTGNVVIEPQLFPGVSEFQSGLAEVHVSDGVYIDKSGKTVISHKFYRGWTFSEGLAVAMPKDGDPGAGKWGYIDTSGDFVIPPKFDSKNGNYVWSFSNGFAKIEVNYKYGFINRSGEFKLPARFLAAESFSDGLARVVIEGPCIYFGGGPCPDPEVAPGDAKLSGDLPACKFSYVDASGHVFPQRFDGARPFSEGLAPVRRGDQWGYIDKTGEFAILPHFSEAEAFSDGVARVRVGQAWGYIDHLGNYAITPQFANTDDFNQGLAHV